MAVEYTKEVEKRLNELEKAFIELCTILLQEPNLIIRKKILDLKEKVQKKIKSSS